MSTIEQTPQPKETKLLPGDILRAKREQKGLSLEEIATRLRLKVSTVEKLESNNIADEQVATFVRGYYKSYAKLVGIQEDEITKATNNLLGDQVKQQPMTSFSKGAHKARHNKRMSSLSWAMFIAIAGISAVWYWQSLQHSTDTVSTEISQEADTNSTEISTTEIEPAKDESQTQHKAPILVEKEAISEMADVNAAEAIETQERDGNNPEADDTQSTATTTAAAIADANADENTNVEETDNSAETADEATSQVADGMKKLVLNFTGDCWMQVKDKDGKVLVSGIKKLGDKVELSDSESYHLTLGAPHVVNGTLDGEAIDLSSYSGGRVARLTVPQE